MTDLSLPQPDLGSLETALATVKLETLIAVNKDLETLAAQARSICALLYNADPDAEDFNVSDAIRLAGDASERLDRWKSMLTEQMALKR